MSRLLRAELLKLRTTRTFVVFVLCALGLSLLIAVLTAALSEQISPEEAAQGAYSDVSSPFILLLAVVATTGEWRHRTIASTVLAAPDRVRLVGAKVIAYALAGVVLSLLVSVCTFLVATVILSARDQPTPEFGDFLALLWRSLVFAAYYGALGVAIGALIRNQAGAIVTVLVTIFVLEPTISALEPDVGQFLPLFGAPSGLFGGTVEESDDALELGLSLLVMAGWVVAMAAAAIGVLRERDLT